MSDFPTGLDRDAILECVAGLPEEDKAIAQMLMAQYTQTQIAAGLGVTQQAISKRVRLWRAVFRL